MKKLTLMMFLLAATSIYAQERTFEVTITNVTKSQIFAPPVVATHSGDYTFYKLGYAGSDALATMAEDGDASGLRDQALESDAVTDAVVGDGVIMPGASVTITVTSNGQGDYVSLAGMLVTTNDAFFATTLRLPGFPRFKRGVALPTRAYATVYDAGTEANTEDCAHIPGPPCGNGGVRVTEGAEGYVHPHSGIHGIADVAPASYDWGNVVAIVEIRGVN